ncbi:hypothetical protein QBC47DRAFT_412345 [Echria macrotheca]|uniref:T6SS Phospholipase effector Tle1-like catalytic domain-containing protein n=1 Tax=Echria macrotheca TaxID=438768 RepID=A0AAJ0BEX6_9PEZI|nr:hypothetical protein QBC47DRAFT_412345 [Echria macrotheca]
MDNSHLMPGGGQQQHHVRGASGTPGTQADEREDFFSTNFPSERASMMDGNTDAHQRSSRKPRKIVLCFDGTGNKFHGDDSDSNILKIYRMLDRTASDQYHYYQPGIGTYVVSNSLSHTSTVARIKSWYMKAKDSAIGSSFDHHVVGGYRFLMRFYSPGDEIYIFGFSRGAYIARFLAEMLDYVGLLSHGNEEMVAFAWKAFSNWQTRQGDNTPEGTKKKKEMYEFMKGFRETFSRPVRRIRFLGLFDTVNSVPQFETAWMQRSKFPYTARTSAKVIRHAVSIDERRAKFRQDLIYQTSRSKKDKARSQAQQKLHEIHEKYRKHGHPAAAASGPDPNAERGRRQNLAVPESPAPYRVRSRSTRSHRTGRTNASEAGHIPNDGHSEISMGLHPHADDAGSVLESEDEHEQDIDEVWFAGGHGDIGGGWEMIPGHKAASHIPLVWMVREAMRAGLHFDMDKVRDLGCAECADEITMTPAPGERQDDQNHAAFHDSEKANHEDSNQHQMVPDIMIRSSSASTPQMLQNASFQHGPDFKPAVSEESNVGGGRERPPTFHEMLHKAHTARIHDSLEFSCGLPKSTILSWRIMEYLPFKRLDLDEEGHWKPIRWPLPCGEVRDIPENARVHGSVIRRMQLDENYRPGNLIVGGGGRGVRVAPKEYGIGEWVCVAEEGDPVGEIWMKKSAVEKA